MASGYSSLHGGSTSILPRKDILYQLYARHIKNVTEAVEGIGLVTGTIRTRIRADIFSIRGIVCTLPPGSEKNSVAQFYYGNMLRNDRDMDSPHTSGIGKRLEDIRNALLRILELHLDIDASRLASDSPDLAENIGLAVENGLFKPRMQQLRALDEYCLAQGIPSVMPNLFQPGVLFKRLHEPEFSKNEDPRLDTFWQLLGNVYMHNGDFLSVIARFMNSRAGRSEEAKELIGRTDEQQDIDFVQLFLGSPSLRRQYIACWVNLGHSEEEISYWRDVLVFPEE